MVDASLEQYIKQKLAEGYSPETLSQFLVQQGYPLLEVNRLIQANAPKEQGGSHARVIFIGLLIVVLVVAGALSVLLIGDVGSTPAVSSKLSVSTRILNVQYEPGKPLDIQVEVVDLLKAQANVAVFLSYRVTDSSSGAVVFFKQETLNLVGERETQRKIYLPDELEKGTYTLQTEATVDQKTFQSSFSFEVKSETPAAGKQGTPALDGKAVQDQAELRAQYVIVQEDPSLTRVRVKEPTLPTGRDFEGMVVKRLSSE